MPDQNSRPVLQCEHLSKAYGKVRVLDSVNLQIRSRERVALLGQNGVGKSTFVECLLGIKRFEQGRVTLLGAAVKQGEAELRQRIGYVGQSSQFPSSLSMNQLFKLLRNIFTNWNQSLAEHLTTQFQLAASHPLHKFSQGMKSQVALIAALSHKPDLLLLDEPFSHLDPITRDNWYSVIKQYCDESNAACLFATHLIEDVREFSSRAIILAHRAIQADLDSASYDVLFTNGPPSTHRSNMPNIAPPQAKIVWRSGKRLVWASKMERKADGLAISASPLDLRKFYGLVAQEDEQ